MSHMRKLVFLVILVGAAALMPNQVDASSCGPFPSPECACGTYPNSAIEWVYCDFWPDQIDGGWFCAQLSSVCPFNTYCSYGTYSGDGTCFEY